MSESESWSDGGPGRREVAHRLFAAEFDDADFEYSESDEERAPNYVVTPTGARVNRLFVVGVLTEIEPVSDGVLRARVVDPTGAFVCYAGQYQPDERAFLERADTPAFVAMTGKARTFQPDDADVVYTSVRPEAVNEVDASTRDRWTLDAAEATIDRVRTAAGALALDQRGDALQAVLEANGVDPALASGIPIAFEEYGTGEAYLASLAEVALDAARLVAGEVDEVEASTLSPDAAVDRPLPVEPRRFEVPADLSTPSEPGVEAEPDLAEEQKEEEEAGRPGTDAGREPTEMAESEAAESETAASETTASEAAGEPEADDEHETVDEPETASETETAAEPETAGEGTTAGESETVGETAMAGEPEAVGEAEPESEGLEEAGVGGPTAPSGEGEATGAAGEDVGDFEPGEFDLDEEEREEIEAEYGTDFQSGTEVDEPGEADIEPPEPEPTGESDDETVEATPDGEEAVGEVDETEDDGSADGEEAGGEMPADADLEDVAVEVMSDLDDGSGAAWRAVVEATVDRTGADEAAVEEAIQSALMDGRCYEPDDDSLQAI